jgi:hypothetical protein
MFARRALIVSIPGFVLLVLVAGLQYLAAAAEEPAHPGTSSTVIELGAIGDNTLYAEDDLLSNGAGQRFFAGATALGDLRRGLVKFDVAGNVPAEAFIVSATLRLHVSKHHALAQPELFTVNRVLSEWGEGTSDAPLEEGIGAAATVGDATWSFSYYSPTPTELISWTNPGGDFLPVASASTVIGVADGYYTWGPEPGIIADLMYWLRFPDKNYGWIVLGNELDLRTARRFDSRENVGPNFRPILIVEYAQAQRQYLPLIAGQ